MIARRPSGRSSERFTVALRRFVRDRRSGAAELAEQATRLLADAAALGYAGDRLDRLKDRLAHAHPAMGAVWNAVRAEAPDRFARDLRRRSRATVRDARRKLPRGARVLTLSYSSTVFETLARRDLRVTVAESLPGGEGRLVARKRARLGLATTVVPDATLAVAAATADCAMIGADAVTADAVINKVGTHLLALACRAAGTPCYVVADATKFVPDSWSAPRYSRERPFEATPRDLFAEVISG